MHSFHALRNPMAHTRCVIMHFVSLFCPHILSFVLCTNFNTFWNQYTDSIVPLPMCLFGVVSGFVRFDLSVNNLSHFVSTLCSQMW